jgi:hypothetical protein
MGVPQKAFLLLVQQNSLLYGLLSQKYPFETAAQGAYINSYWLA